VTALLSIGEFATVTHLSVKTLRRYHEDGLLEPDQVDPHSGYRYYSTDQVPTAQVIRRFRDLDMPVREIARLLAADVDERATLITDHLARLQQRLAATTEAVGALQRLLTAEPRPLPVEHRREPSRRVKSASPFAYAWGDPPGPFAVVSYEVHDPALAKLISGFAADARRAR